LRSLGESLGIARRDHPASFPFYDILGKRARAGDDHGLAEVVGMSDEGRLGGIAVRQHQEPAAPKEVERLVVADEAAAHLDLPRDRSGPQRIQAPRPSHDEPRDILLAAVQHRSSRDKIIHTFVGLQPPEEEPPRFVLHPVGQSLDSLQPGLAEGKVEERCMGHPFRWHSHFQKPPTIAPAVHQQVLGLVNDRLVPEVEQAAIGSAGMRL
jgi:hypothetical protein